MLTVDSLIPAIEAHLERTKMSETAFGLAAVGDPNFIRDVRAGREPRRRMIRKVEAYIDGRPTAPQQREAAE
jgi:hypothetical protein